MIWTTPKAWSDNDLVIESRLSNELKDNVNYLKYWSDQLDSTNEQQPSLTSSPAERLLSTDYLNGDLIRLVTVTVEFAQVNYGNSGYLIAYVDGEVAAKSGYYFYNDASNGPYAGAWVTLSFAVPPRCYYKVEYNATNSTPSIQYWIEDDLHAPQG